MLGKKMEDLEGYLRDLGKVALAFSAGVDSTFLLYNAVRILGKDRVLALTILGDVYPDREAEEARKISQDLGIEQVFVRIDVDSLNYFRENTKDRCYFCKKDIFSTIKKEAKSRGFENVLDGTNLDDLSDYRPGLKAIEELGILSPLKKVGLSKEDIRIISKDQGIPSWNKVSMACLASRIAYDSPISSKLLGQIEDCENYLRDLGFLNFRVRSHGELARIEIDQDEMEKLGSIDRKDLLDYFKSRGFIYVCLDLEGYSMGSMNKLIGEV